MTQQKPVVVYAASGYTGRLTCESLTRLGVPFVAAGRNQAKLEQVARDMRAEGADCVARAVEHSPQGLRELFRGARVCINISGPFSLLGRAVVEAAHAEGCHYVDSTGEQDFMLDMKRELGPRFQRDELVLAPSVAYLWALGTAAAERCLETTPGIDDLEVVYAPPSLQTVASLQSMIRTARRPGYCLADGDLRRMPPAQTKRVPIPGEASRKAMRIGAGETVFFQDDSRVQGCDTLFASDDLARAARPLWVWNRLSAVVPGEKLDAWSDFLVGKLKKEPPREEPETGRFTVVVTGRGGGRAVRAVMKGTSPYVVTGFLGAVAAQALLEGEAQRFGFVSMAQAFGARRVLERLEEIDTFTRLETEAGGQAGTNARRDEPDQSAPHDPR